MIKTYRSSLHLNTSKAFACVYIEALDRLMGFKHGPEGETLSNFELKKAGFGGRSMATVRTLVNDGLRYILNNYEALVRDAVKAGQLFTSKAKPGYIFTKNDFLALRASIKFTPNEENGNLLIRFTNNNVGAENFVDAVDPELLEIANWRSRLQDWLTMEMPSATQTEENFRIFRADKLSLTEAEKLQIIEMVGDVATLSVSDTSILAIRN